jgi:low affinity Fe/Cu permease
MSHNSSIKTSTLILACILLIGVISMAYGYYQSNKIIIYGGVAVVFVISIFLQLQNILYKKETKRKFNIYK